MIMGMDEQMEGEDIDESNNLYSSVKISELSSWHDSPLYAGLPITFSVSLLLIITFAMRHNLTGFALADLLTLINVHLLVPNCFAKSTAGISLLLQFLLSVYWTEKDFLLFKQVLLKRLN